MDCHIIRRSRQGVGKTTRRLRKLGDYVQIIQQMPSLVEKAGNAEITVEQVLT